MNRPPNEEIVTLSEDLSESPLYSPDLAPVPPRERTWNTWSMAAVWVGMAVCIPTYLLASYMIKSGLGWGEALLIIFAANVIVALPMVLNGHAGVKYGIPFPVLGRAAFGVWGVHVPSIVRGIVACGWFGIQTWIGGLALYAIWCALLGWEMSTQLTFGKFVGFGLFWVMNIYFVWKGTESIKWLEVYAAPILILIGIVLIAWGASKGGGFANVLAQSRQMQVTTASIEPGDPPLLVLKPLRDLDGKIKADSFRIVDDSDGAPRWHALNATEFPLSEVPELVGTSPGESVRIVFGDGQAESSPVEAVWIDPDAPARSKWWTYLFWLTAMVGFWATMSISIADITRYVSTQKQQMVGQFLGLPGTMLLYSFVGVFVTCAALILFGDVLTAEDAPWDPVSLLAKFEHPVVVIVAQFFMILATLSTNIAANVIAPANAFSNAFPKKLTFFGGGLVTGLIAIVICPWWLLDEISGLLIFVSGLLGPVLGILLADYFVVRHTHLDLAELFKPKGQYAYLAGINPVALTALVVGVLVALTGYWVPGLAWLYRLSWFTGFIVAFVTYIVGMRMYDHGSPRADQTQREAQI